MLMSCLGFGTLSEIRMSLWARGDVWLTQEHYRITRTNTHTQSHTPCEEWQWSICVQSERIAALDHCLCDLAQVECVLCVYLCVCVCVTGWCKWDSDSFFFCPPHHMFGFSFLNTNAVYGCKPCWFTVPELEYWTKLCVCVCLCVIRRFFWKEPQTWWRRCMECLITIRYENHYNEADGFICSQLVYNISFILYIYIYI